MKYFLVKCSSGDVVSRFDNLVQNLPPNSDEFCPEFENKQETFQFPKNLPKFSSEHVDRSFDTSTRKFSSNSEKFSPKV